MPKAAVWLAVPCAVVCCTFALSAPAMALNLFSLDATPEEAGAVVTESSGTGYFAWERESPIPGGADTTLFCKIPRGGSCSGAIVLPLPAPGTNAEESVTQAFPVLGTRPGVVYVVGPRYVPNDVLIWTSTNGGASFSAPKTVAAKHMGTGVDDVLINPLREATEKEPTADIFDVASTNPGLIFDESGNTAAAKAGFSFASPGPFPDGGSLGFTAAGNPVLAYFNLAATDEIHDYQNTGSPADEEKHWSGPKKVTEGEFPRLAGGPAGLFMLSDDFPSGESNPAVLDVRAFNESTGDFEAPVEVSGSVDEDLPANIDENPVTGVLYVVWPVLNGAGELLFTVAESTDGGHTFHGQREVAQVRGGYGAPPRLAVAEDGQGWITWEDEGGIEVANMKVGTTLATTLSGGGQSGASISVDDGTSVTDAATLGGQVASSAGGTVGYELFTNSSCSGNAIAAGSAGLSGGVAGASTAENLPPGKYFWRATYTGEDIHEPSQSPCGSEVLTVLALTSTTTAQSGDGVSASSLTLPQGASVTDQAHLAGALASSATGTVTYRFYKDSKCTKEGAATSVVSVAGGQAAASAPVKPGVGTYYWKTEYSGDGANEASASACGSEVLTIATKDSSLGLPSTHSCLSRRKFIAHPRAPRGVKLVHVEIFINGALKAQGPLNHHHATIDLVGLPKGTFHVALVVRSSSGKLYEDLRTYHTCVPGKHKKKKKK